MKRIIEKEYNSVSKYALLFCGSFYQVNCNMLEYQFDTDDNLSLIDKCYCPIYNNLAEELLFLTSSLRIVRFVYDLCHKLQEIIWPCFVGGKHYPINFYFLKVLFCDIHFLIECDMVRKNSLQFLEVIVVVNHWVDDFVMPIPAVFYAMCFLNVSVKRLYTVYVSEFTYQSYLSRVWRVIPPLYGYDYGEDELVQLNLSRFIKYSSVLSLSYLELVDIFRDCEIMPPICRYLFSRRAYSKIIRRYELMFTSSECCDHYQCFCDVRFVAEGIDIRVKRVFRRWRSISNVRTIIKALLYSNFDIINAVIVRKEFSYLDYVSFLFRTGSLLDIAPERFFVKDKKGAFLRFSQSY